MFVEPNCKFWLKLWMHNCPILLLFLIYLSVKENVCKCEEISATRKIPVETSFWKYNKSPDIQGRLRVRKSRCRSKMWTFIAYYCAYNIGSLNNIKRETLIVLNNDIHIPYVEYSATNYILLLHILFIVHFFTCLHIITIDV